MHVKLNAIKVFNRLSLLADQNASTVKLSHSKLSNSAKSDDFDCEKADAANNINLATRKFIMSSSLQLHEDDLSRIDVKSLVSNFLLFRGAYEITSLQVFVHIF